MIDDATYAMRQAAMTADAYLGDALGAIDTYLGKGYARQHPELIAAFMRTAAQDFHTTMMKTALQDLRDVFGEIDSALRGDSRYSPDP
jgi:hypothetical protein